MIAPGRGVADRAAYPRLVIDNPRPPPAWVPEPPRPSVGPALLMWAGAVLGGWCFVAGLAWTAHAICNVTGIIRP